MDSPLRALDDDLTLLETAVQEAGEIAMRYWRKTPKAWEKPDQGGPVTEADLQVNAHLETRLRAARPDYGWLSEESLDGTERLAAARCFIVDPIDGTRSFIQGEDTFSIVAGISDGHQMRAGAVWLPALKRLYSAHAQGPARYNGQEIRVSDARDPEGATMLTTAVNLRADYWPGGVPKVRRAFRPSLAYRMCLVAEGRHDSMATFRPTWEWDIAAATLIAERAGATVTDCHGAGLAFNRADPRVSGVLAAPADLHRALLRLAQTTP